MTDHKTPARPDSAPFWDAALECQSRAGWDALKLASLQRHLQHAYHNYYS